MTTIRVCQATDAVCAFQNVCDAKYCVMQAYPATQKPETFPVRTVTRKEIVPGNYGPLGALSIKLPGEGDNVYIGIDSTLPYSTSEIREFARLFTEIADAMEDQAR